MANVLTDRAAQRVKSAIQWVEGNRAIPASTGAEHARVEAVTVRVTSDTADGYGNYPGVVVAFDGTNWADYDTVKVRPANDEGLTNTRRYPARRAGLKDGDPVYIAEGYVGGHGDTPYQSLAFWYGLNEVRASVCKEGGHLLWHSTISSGPGEGICWLNDIMVSGKIVFPGSSALPGYLLFADADTDVYGFMFEAGALYDGQLLAVVSSPQNVHTITLKHGSGFVVGSSDLRNGGPLALDPAYDVGLSPGQAAMYVWSSDNNVFSGWFLAGSSAPVPSAYIAPTEIDGGTW